MSIIPLVAMLLWQFVGGPPSPQIKKPPRAPRLFPVPGKSYALSLDLSGFVVSRDEINDKAGERNISLSIKGSDRGSVICRIWPAEKPGDAKICREMSWSDARQSVLLSGPTQRDLDGIALVEYTECRMVSVRILRGYLVHKETWFEIQLERMSLEESERILRSVKIVVPFQSDVETALAGADRLFARREYDKAATRYQPVLDSEKTTRTLDQKAWRGMIDQLGKCYRLTRRHSKARETFEYGIAEDRVDPMLHYDLARTLADMDDLSNAITQLKKAYQYKRNLLEGKRMPDPRREPSFRKYFSSPEFQSALRVVGA